MWALTDLQIELLWSSLSGEEAQPATLSKNFFKKENGINL